MNYFWCEKPPKSTINICDVDFLFTVWHSLIYSLLSDKLPFSTKNLKSVKVFGFLHSTYGVKKDLLIRWSSILDFAFELEFLNQNCFLLERLNFGLGWMVLFSYQFSVWNECSYCCCIRYAPDFDEIQVLLKIKLESVNCNLLRSLKFIFPDLLVTGFINLLFFS